MPSQAILLPAIVMFLLTFFMLLYLGVSRFIAIKKREVNIKYFTQYLGDIGHERLHLINRHVQNHFEVPPLFYIAVALLIMTDQVSQVAVFAAWAFVGLRMLHSLIHLGANNVNLRFMAFGLSLFALLTLWFQLILSLL